MYTVVRFYSASSSDTAQFAVRLHQRMPSMVDPSAIFSHGFSCSLCNSSDWQEHLEAIASFASQADVLDDAAQSQISVELDIAIFSHDRKGLAAKCLRLAPSLLLLLAQSGISIEFSIYASSTESGATGANASTKGGEIDDL